MKYLLVVLLASATLIGPIVMGEDRSDSDSHVYPAPSRHQVSAPKATQQDVQKTFHDLTTLPGPKQAFTPEECQALFDTASNNPVANLDALAKYDPSGQIGFCFGRAMAVHLIARKMGLADGSVKKLFVIGDLRSGGDPEWRFHVTTIVKGTDGKWHAIDPIMTPPLANGTPMPVDEWIKIIQHTWDKKHQAHYYTVTNDSVIPDLRIVPDVKKEKGDRIIEVSFKPENKNGFQIDKSFEKPVFALSPDAENSYFLRATSSKPENQFQFLGLTINGENFDFNNYFADLTKSIQSSDTKVFATSARTVRPQATTSKNKLGSPKLPDLLRGLK